VDSSSAANFATLLYDNLHDKVSGDNANVLWHLLNGYMDKAMSARMQEEILEAVKLIAGPDILRAALSAVNPSAIAHKEDTPPHAEPAAAPPHRKRRLSPDGEAQSASAVKRSKGIVDGSEAAATPGAGPIMGDLLAGFSEEVAEALSDDPYAALTAGSMDSFDVPGSGGAGAGGGGGGSGGGAVNSRKVLTAYKMFLKTMSHNMPQLQAVMARPGNGGKSVAKALQDLWRQLDRPQKQEHERIAVGERARLARLEAAKASGVAPALEDEHMPTAEIAAASIAAAAAVNTTAHLQQGEKLESKKPRSKAIKKVVDGNGKKRARAELPQGEQCSCVAAPITPFHLKSQTNPHPAPCTPLVRFQ